MRFLLLFLLFIGLFQLSCKTTRELQVIHSNLPEVVQFKNDNKTIQFIPMHHVGKAVYYNNVRDLVKELKHDGYVVYYEFVNEEMQTDSTALDTYKRKFRKLVGFQLDSGGYASAFHSRGMLLHLVNQPKYPFFGIDSSDRRVDVSTHMIVDAYENKYGVIELDPSDKSLPLEGVAFVGSNRPPKDQVMSILIDYRNSHLAEAIHKSEHRKIVVMYGASHLDGTFARLHELDPLWKRD